MITLQAIADLDDLALDLPRFEHALNQLAAKLQLDLSQFSANQISARCHQDVTAERWRQGLMQCTSLLSELMINGRVICLFDLQQPLNVGPWRIDCVELPYPGVKRYLHEGWEHLALVLSGDPNTLHARALSYLADEALLAQGIMLKQSVPEGEGDRLPNPTLVISDGSMTIKFHPYPIREIVASEKS